MTTGSRTNCEIKSSGQHGFVFSSVVRTGAGGILLALATPVFSDTELSLTGSVTQTDISGFAGTPFTVGHPESTQAVYRVWSVERNDKPCYVGALTEDINNSKDITGEIKSLCGNNPTSKEMKVQFGGIKFAEYTFVRALRVCMNKDNTRLKGLQIRGRKIDENGNVSDLPARYPDSSGSSGLTPLVDLNAPSDQRPNCDGWKNGWNAPRIRLQLRLLLISVPERIPGA